MAENAICLCKPGTIPLYKAVAPSFLTIETRVPSWDDKDYDGDDDGDDDGDGGDAGQDGFERGGRTWKG